MDTTTTLTAYQLAELLRKVEPHIGSNSEYFMIQGIRLDYDGRYLHAVATDRYTIAVARQKTRSQDPAWAYTLHGTDVDVLTAWLKARGTDDAHNIHITPGENGITFTEGEKTTGLTIHPVEGTFPQWRGLFRSAMETPIGEAPYSRIRPSLLARWETVGREVSTWQASATKPIVIVGCDFLGLQMPCRFTGDDTAPNIADDIATWAGSLAGATPIEQDDDLDIHEPEELADRDNAIGREIESLLKLTLRSTANLFAAATEDTGALVGYALAGTQSWTAYRLVKALQKADPDLLRTVLADTSEQLESGEIGEWAWDEAEKAGHNPQQWQDDYEAHLKALKAKKAAAAA